MAIKKKAARKPAAKKPAAKSFKVGRDRKTGRFITVRAAQGRGPGAAVVEIPRAGAQPKAKAAKPKPKAKPKAKPAARKAVKAKPKARPKKK
jgi:histone H1/5